jgi:hypothetical protein
MVNILLYILFKKRRVSVGLIGSPFNFDCVMKEVPAFEASAMRRILMALFVLSALAAWTTNAGAGEYYTGGAYYADYYGARPYWASPVYYNTGYAYWPTLFGFPIFNSDFPAYDTPCVRHVRVYDDAGGWVWGLRYYC